MLRCRFDIEAEQDPQVATRILHLLATLNEVPEKFCLEKDGDQVRIMLEMLLEDEPQSRLWGRRIQNIPTVIYVTRAVFPTASTNGIHHSSAPAFWI